MCRRLGEDTEVCADDTWLVDSTLAEALANQKVDERDVAIDIFEAEPGPRQRGRRRGAPQLRRLRQIIESVNNTLKAHAQLSLEGHGGHTAQGVAVRIMQRLLA